MSGELGPVRSVFWPPSVDGVNLIAPPAQLKDTEAREILNYWVYDTGLRQMPPFVQTITYTGSDSGVQLLNSYDSIIFYAAQNKIYKLASATSNSPTDVTGAATITVNQWNPVVFNKRLFLFNGVDTPLYHDYGGGNVTAFSVTGPTEENLKQGTGYKSRFYIVESGTTKYWYGDVDAFAGTFTDVDVGSIFSLGSSSILCVFTWSYNQGDGNEELFCILSNRGEILIYSGDNPSADNWTIIFRGTIPLPGGYASSPTGQPFCRIGSDVYITTQRGALPLSSIVAGTPVSDAAYAISRKIKNQIANDTIGGAVDRINPFAYFRDTSDLSALYVLNYERGAWSRYKPVIPAVGGLTQSILSVRFFENYMLLGTGVPNGTAGSLGYVDLSAGASSDLTYRWKLGFSNLGSQKVKHVGALRVLGMNFDDASTFSNTVSISTDFVDPSAAQSTSASASVAANTETVQELRPPGIGRWISPVFSRVGAGVSDERNELHGFEMLFQEGGAY